MPNPISDSTPVLLRRFTKFVVFWTFFTIFAGAMVTSTGSGLAVPDWPLSYGMLMPPMIGGIFYEHGHRMIAATVGLFAVINALWLQFREPKRFVRTLGWCALGLVLVQGLLGGLTVLHLLPLALSMSHALVAEIFLCLNVAIAFFTSDFFASLRRLDRGDAPVGWTTALVLVVYAQILIGALMRHLGAGLAIPDFPLSFGHIIPSFASVAVIVNFAHRAGAVIVAFIVIAVAIKLLRFERGHPLRGVAAILVTLVSGQILLGAYTVWSAKQPHITSLHVMTGASTLATSLVLCLMARTLAWRSSHEHARPMMRSEVAA